MHHRVLLRCLLALLLGGGVVVGTAGPAAAHANLLGTEPAYGAALASGPGRVLVRYDLPVEVKGAQVTLERSGRALRAGRPVYASPDHKDVSVPLPELGSGKYVLTWFLFGSDGDVMGGELAFSVLSAAGPGATAAGAPAPGGAPGVLTTRSFAPLSRAQDAARLAASASLAVLLGGMTFVALLWPAGAHLRRTRLLLWVSLAGALVANVGALGLKGAAVQGRSGLLAVVSPTALTALDGTHVGRVLMARVGFLLLAVPVVALLTVAPRRAVRSHRWWAAAAVCALGALTTHGMLSHAYARGPLASATNVVHLAGVVVWLGGLAVLAVVVLPRRRGDEVSVLLRRFSNLAFVAVATAAVAGAALLLLISPRWTALPTSAYGRLLFGKLALVAVLLAAASRARNFVWRRLPLPTAVGAKEMSPGVAVAPVRLQPLVSAVTAELCIAASILATTALLVGRPPPT